MSVIDNSNFMGAVCEIADKLLMEKFNHDYKITHTIEEGMSKYTPFVQDVFNYFYDEVEHLLITELDLVRRDDSHWEVKQ